MIDFIIAAMLTVGGPGGDVQPAPDRANRRICRRSEEATGTRMAPRICRTAAEWEALRRGRRSANDSQQGDGNEDRVGHTTESPR